MSSLSADSLAAAVWGKSSYSNGNGGSNCVEVAEVSTAIAVRDSKDPHGGVLVFNRPAWNSFVIGLKTRTLAEQA